jgi:hypothetical protein
MTQGTQGTANVNLERKTGQFHLGVATVWEAQRSQEGT